MKRILPVAGPVLGLLIAALATAVAVRSWLAERSLEEGRSAQSRGDLRGAAEAYADARDRGNADAALELARLAFLSGDWEKAERYAREAAALAPTRAHPHVLRSAILLAKPGAWDRAREDLVLEGCRNALLFEPGSWSDRSGCGGMLLELAARRRESWDPPRREAVRREAVDAYAGAYALAVRLEKFQSGVPHDRRPARLVLAAAEARGADAGMLDEITRSTAKDRPADVD